MNAGTQAGEWVRVVAGHRYCTVGHHFFDASPENCAWMWFAAGGVVGSSCVCDECAQRLPDDEAD